jgi:hypothetical protein
MEAQPRTNNKRHGPGAYGPITQNRSDQSLPGQVSGGESSGQQDKPDDYIQNVRGIGSLDVAQRQPAQDQKHFISVDESYQQQRSGGNRAQRASPDNENIFNLVNQRSNSQNSLHRVPIKSRKEQQ